MIWKRENLKKEDFLKEIFNFTVNGVNKIKNIRSNVICDTRVKKDK